MAWVPIHQSLTSHRKTIEVADALDLPEVYIVGHLTALWLWAMDNAPDGVLPNSDRIIARAAQWPGDAAQFVNALIDAGFLDLDGPSRIIHQWEEYGGKLLHKREANAERMREARAAQPKSTNKQRAMHVQRTLQKCAEPEKRRIDKSTEEYSTTTNTIPTENNSSGGGGVRTPAQENHPAQKNQAPPPPPKIIRSPLNPPPATDAEKALCSICNLSVSHAKPEDLGLWPNALDVLHQTRGSPQQVQDFGKWFKSLPSSDGKGTRTKIYLTNFIDDFSDYLQSLTAIAQVNQNGTHKPTHTGRPNGYHGNPKLAAFERGKSGDREIEQELLRRRQLEQSGSSVGGSRS